MALSFRTRAYREPGEGVVPVGEIGCQATITAGGVCPPYRVSQKRFKRNSNDVRRGWIYIYSMCIEGELLVSDIAGLAEGFCYYEIALRASRAFRN